MSFNGSGTFSIINTFVPGTTILSSAVNQNFTDIASGLSDCLTRDNQAGMTGAFRAIAGAAATPSITFTPDATTGAYLPNPGQFAIGTNATNALTISSTQTTTLVSMVASSASVVGAMTIGSTLTLSGTGAMVANVGTSAQRPGSPSQGMVRFNSDNGGLEFYDGTTWNPVSPIAPRTGFKNLSIVNAASAQSVTLSFDECFVQNSTGKAQRIGSTSQTMTISANVAGGGNLDTGAVASNTLYYIHELYNASAATALGVFSLSPTSPTLPSGYTYSTRLGATFTATTGTNLRKISQLGRTAQYVVSASTTTNLPIMLSGVSGTPSTGSWTAISVTPFVPSTASKINVSLISLSNSISIISAPNNSYGGSNSNSNPPPLCVVNSEVSVFGSFVLESTNIYYASNSANGEIVCVGWEDNL